eukprot:scaffold360310_cov31-Attheya_sp.AAC.1
MECLWARLCPGSDWYSRLDCLYRLRSTFQDLLLSRCRWIQDPSIGRRAESASLSPITSV